MLYYVVLYVVCSKVNITVFIFWVKLSEVEMFATVHCSLVTLHSPGPAPRTRPRCPRWWPSGSAPRRPRRRRWTAAGARRGRGRGRGRAAARRSAAGSGRGGGGAAACCSRWAWCSSPPPDTQHSELRCYEAADRDNFL